jgi:curved DNA-binding protein CbpA
MKKIRLTESQYKEILKEAEDYSSDGGFRNFINKELKSIGVDKDIKDMDDKEKRSAKRKLALKYHPDKNPQNPRAATAKFTKISSAFDLSDDPNNYNDDYQSYQGGQRSSQGGQQGKPFKPTFGTRDFGKEFEDLKKKFNDPEWNPPPPNYYSQAPKSFFDKVTEKAKTLKNSLGKDWNNLVGSLEEIFNMAKDEKISKEEAQRKAQEEIKKAQDRAKQNTSNKYDYNKDDEFDAMKDRYEKFAGKNFR